MRHSAVVEGVLAGTVDAEVLDWCFSHGCRPSAEELFASDGFLSMRGLRDNQTEERGFGQRTNIQTLSVWKLADPDRTPAGHSIFARVWFSWRRETCWQKRTAIRDSGPDSNTSMQHIEQHFSGSDMVRDVVIGMADGLTVPFALAAGISGALTSTQIVVTAGIAEVAAGSIAMGLGGYLAAKSDAEHYQSERRREEQEIRDKTDVEKQEVVEIFKAYGVTADECAPILSALQRKPEAWRDFMMRFELGLEEPDPKRAVHSAVTIAISYIVGGLVPLAPYILMRDSGRALVVSSDDPFNARKPASGYDSPASTGPEKADSAGGMAAVNRTVLWIHR